MTSVHLYYQKTKNSVLALTLPTFILVGSFGAISFIEPGLFDEDYFLILTIIVVVLFSIALTLMIYFNYGSAFCEVSVNADGVTLTIMRKRLFFKKDRFIPMEDIANFSFENMNGEYVEIKLRSSKEIVRLLKRATTLSRVSAKTENDYKEFCDALMQYSTEFNIHSRGKDAPKITNQSFWRTQKGRMVGYFLIGLDIVLVIIFVISIFFEFAFESWKAAWIIVITLPILNAIFGREKKL